MNRTALRGPQQEQSEQQEQQQRFLLLLRHVFTNSMCKPEKAVGLRISGRCEREDDCGSFPATAV